MQTVLSTGLVVFKQNSSKQAKAEYIAMSSALHKVIPLMTLMKELHTIFPVHINNQTSSVKSMRKINPQLE